MKLIGFTSWHDERYDFIGTFEDEHLTEEEIARINYEEKRIAWEATVPYLREHGIKFSGIYHEKGKYGVPYFDNGKKLCLGCLAWGYLMGEALNITTDEWAYLVEPSEFVLPYGEQSDDRFHWKNDPIARNIVKHLYNVNV